jgi:hypothetical protein
MLWVDPGRAKHHATKMHGQVAVYFRSFITFALYGAEWLASCSGFFTPRER